MLRNSIVAVVLNVIPSPFEITADLASGKMRKILSADLLLILARVERGSSLCPIITVPVSPQQNKFSVS